MEAAATGTRMRRAVRDHSAVMKLGARRQEHGQDAEGRQQRGVRDDRPQVGERATWQAVREDDGMTSELLWREPGQSALGDLSPKPEEVHLSHETAA